MMYSILGQVQKYAVASTKAYTTQLAAFYMIALDFAIKEGTIKENSTMNDR